MNQPLLMGKGDEMTDDATTGRESNRNSEVDNLKKELELLRRENEQLRSGLQESVDRYDRMLGNLEEEFLFFRHDLNGVFTYISPSYSNILGFAPEEYLGLKVSSLWTPNSINKIAERSTQLSCQGIRQPPYEMEIYHKSGALRRFVNIETPIFNDKGKVVAVEGTARDITEKRKIEEQLDRYRIMLEDLVKQRTEELEISQKQQKDIIDFLPYPIFVVDTERIIIAWNRAMAQITGIEQDEVLGKEYEEWLKKFYNPDDPITVQLILDGLYQESQRDEKLVQGLERDHSIQFDGRKILTERSIPSLYNGKGGDIWITAGPILDKDDRLLGAIESLRDVTQLKRAERQRQLSEQRLSTLMGNLPGMAYRVSLYENSWQVDFVSKGCRQIYDREESYFIGKKLEELRHLIHPDDIERVQESATAAVAGGDALEVEYRIMTASGKTKWVFDKAEILQHNVDGRLSVEGFTADFTLFKKMEESLRNENMLLRSTIKDRYKFHNIIGNCQAMQDVFEHIVKAATTNDNVFIYGESGTGKEVVAHAIHETSERKHKKFIAVNCAAIPESLIESEFFGISKGAYTGAHSSKAGYLESADGGTLFLDEIGDISPSLQVKLLRAIEGGGFSPVGSRRMVQPNLRIIAASNKDLKQLVTAGNIRQDFFFRIHVIPIHLPPLRERGDDLYLLVNHFLKQYGIAEGITTLSRIELETLRSHPWPGNVRELQNVLRRFMTMRNLHFMDIAEPVVPAPPTPEVAVVEANPNSGDLKNRLSEVEKKTILEALEKTRWNRSKACKELGVSRKTLFRKMKACGLN